MKFRNISWIINDRTSSYPLLCPNNFLEYMILKMYSNLANLLSKDKHTYGITKV